MQQTDLIGASPPDRQAEVTESKYRQIVSMFSKNTSASGGLAAVSRQLDAPVFPRAVFLVIE